MFFLPGSVNSGDDMTKPLAWMLHARHCRRNMGHYKIVLPDGSDRHVPSYYREEQSSKPGRVLEPNLDPVGSSRKYLVTSSDADASEDLNQDI